MTEYVIEFSDGYTHVTYEYMADDFESVIEYVKRLGNKLKFSRARIMKVVAELEDSEKYYNDVDLQVVWRDDE